MTHPLASPAQIEALANAMWQLLDDMGRHGNNTPCRAAVAQARIAYEPFNNEREAEPPMTLTWAISVMKEVERANQ